MIEIDKFTADFDDLQQTLEHYEINMRKIVSMNVRQERSLNETMHALHHHLKDKSDYLNLKETARTRLDGHIRDKLAHMQNHCYLTATYDFYSAGIRLAAAERPKIARNRILRAMEREKSLVVEKNEELEAEVEAMRILLRAA